jgi:hypothetical protein
MNFFSHAVVARSFSEDPEFVLGARLPDFASMLGARLPEVAHVTLARGVRFHHVTDHVFHELETFRMLSREAHGELRERGVGRGASRAVAHVGIEILLDIALGQSAPAEDAYLSGLEAGLRHDFSASLAWPARECERLRDLLETLRSRGVVRDTSSAIVVERIKRTLARRPRLALADDDPPRVLEWVERARSRVVGSTPALLASLQAELERRLAS